MAGLIAEEVVGANVKLESPIVITNVLIPPLQASSFVFENNLIPDVFILIISSPVYHIQAYFVTLYVS